MKKKMLFLLFALLNTFYLSGCSSNTPYIGENGNWWINSTDLGVPATGPKGDTGAKGDTGPKGDKGDSITVVSVNKIKTEGKNDIYEIVFSDGTSSTFTVTNGSDGSSISVIDVSLKSSENNIDTYEILFSDGYKTTFTVTNGQDLSILSIEKVSTSGLFDTYRINYSNGKYIEFVVGNGATPYIGENGNWWINNIDTGVIADYSKEDQRMLTIKNKICSAGLVYTPMTIKGKSGFVVTNYDSSLATSIAINDYTELSNGLTKENYSIYVSSILNNVELVVPNYIGSIPVIGIGDEAFSGTNIKSISISKNTIYLGNGAFSSTPKLSEFNFNGSKITYISESCFSNSGITHIKLPSSVTTLYDNAFSKCKLTNFDLSNITYFGQCSLDELADDYVWLSKKVKYVGHYAFKGNFIYVEKGTDYSKWNDSGDINGILQDNYYYEIGVITDCYKNSDLIYSYNDENGITAYKWLKQGKIIEVDSIIDGKNVTRIGSGFAVDFAHVYNASKNGKFSNSLKQVEQIKLPNTVKIIDYGAIDVYGAIVYIPSSVERIYEGTCSYGNNHYGTSYLAFESEQLPNFISGIYSSSQEIITSDEWLNGYGKNAKYGKGLDFTKIKYSESDYTFYYVEDTQASILTCMDIDANNIKTKDVFEDKPVKTIMSYAYDNLPNLKAVVIGDNIMRIQKYAFESLKLSVVFIPQSVSIVGKYGFNNCCDKFYIGSVSIPDDWDSYWCGTTSPNVEFNTQIENIEIGEYHGFYYFSFGNEIVLYSNNISSKVMILPSEIDGVPVTTINSGFDLKRIKRNLYIPNSIINVEKYAFNLENGSNVYLESSKIPNSFDNYWWGTSSNVNDYYNSVMPMVYENNFIYIEYDSQITLLQYIGNDGIIYIPRTINNKPVTIIAEDFANLNHAMKIYIPNNVNSIDSKAFITNSTELWEFYFESSKGNDGYYNSNGTSNSNKIDIYSQTFNY